MIAVTDPPQDFTGFLIWSLVIVCGTLATLAGAAIRWTVSKLAAKEIECRAERQEDQKSFLLSLSALNTHIDGQTAAIKENTARLVEHDKKMDRAHSVEVSEIATLAGRAAVATYLRENPPH